MAKLNLWDHGVKSWVGYFILESLDNSGEDNNPIVAADYNAESMEAKLIINGIELPLERTFKHLGSKFEEMVEQRAKELIKERLDENFINSLNKISRLSNELEEELERKIDMMMR